MPLFSLNKKVWQYSVRLFNRHFGLDFKIPLYLHLLSPFLHVSLMGWLTPWRRHTHNSLLIMGQLSRPIGQPMVRVRPCGLSCARGLGLASRSVGGWGR